MKYDEESNSNVAIGVIYGVASYLSLPKFACNLERRVARSTGICCPF